MNPTRVIQRLGRINRIDARSFKHYIFITSSYRARCGSGKSREIAAQKMFLIHNTLGEDSKIFAADETPSPAELFKRINRNPEEDEEESLLTTVRDLYFSIKEQHPDFVK